MRLKIRHETAYEYDGPSVATVQLLRLTPRSHAGLRVLHWRVTNVAPPAFTDAFGNPTHLRTIQGARDRISVIAEGEVETTDTAGRITGIEESMPVGIYLRSTPRTEADPAIAALTAETADADGILDRLHRLMGLVRERVAYRVGTTDADTSAAEALAAGEGVCQDHAHLFAACARLCDVPARYVSGYFWPGTNGKDEPASHAWAEALVPGLGWVGFDPANGQCPTEAYVRIAVGLDSWSAAPVRGIRRGSATEQLAVAVRVDRMSNGPTGGEQ